MKNSPATVFIPVIFAVFEIRLQNLIVQSFLLQILYSIRGDQIFITKKLCKNVYLELLFISSHATVVLLTSMLPLKYEIYCLKDMVLCNIMHV